MADIFSRENDAYGASFAADGAVFTFPQFFDADGSEVGGAGLLTQSLGISYNQLISKIYEIGTNRCYYIGGRTNGSMSLARIIGPRPVQKAFYEQFGDVCDVAQNNMDIRVRAGCPTGPNDEGFAGDSIFQVKFAIIMSIGLNVAAQDLVINESLQGMFGSLNLG